MGPRSKRLISWTPLILAFVASVALFAQSPEPPEEEADEEESEPAEEEPAESPPEVLALPTPALLPKVNVAPRTPVLEESEMFPCSTCHEPDVLDPNPAPRELEDEHDELKLVHGGGRFWCLTCHHESDRDQLTSLKGEPISWDDSHLLCGQCHFEQQTEFLHGAHGKRLNGWRDEAVVAPCTSCHDSHSPALKPRKPYRAELVREGLGKPHIPKGHALRLFEKRSHERAAHD